MSGGHAAPDISVSPSPLSCHICSKTFTRRNNLNIHVRSHEGIKPFVCLYCSIRFTRKSNLKIHIIKLHESIRGQVGANHSCITSNQPSSTSSDGRKNEAKRKSPTTPEGKRPSSAQTAKRKCTQSSTTESRSSPLQAQRRMPYNIGGFIQTESVAGNRLLTYKITPEEEETSGCLHSFLNNIKDSAIQILQRNLEDYPTIKTNIFMEATYKKPRNGNPEEFEYCTRNLKTAIASIYRATDLGEFFDGLSRKLLNENSECEMKDSGWIFCNILWLELRVNRFSPLYRVF